MWPYRLEVAGGGLVTNGEMIPFPNPPDVMIWGLRIFKFHNEEVNGTRVYRECFAFYCIDQIMTPEKEQVVK